MLTSPMPNLESVKNPKAEIDKTTLSYFRARQKSRLYDFLIRKFWEKEKAGVLSRADLARRLNKDPAQISRWLAMPTNWTLDTVSDLALAVLDGEIEFESKQLNNMPKRNSTPMAVLTQTSAFNGAKINYNSNYSTYQF